MSLHEFAIILLIKILIWCFLVGSIPSVLIKFCCFIRSLVSAIGSDPKYRKLVGGLDFFLLFHLFFHLLGIIIPIDLLFRGVA